MEHLLGLFEQLRSNDNDLIENSSAEIIELMKNLEVIGIILEIFSSDCDIFYRQQSILLLKAIIKSNKEEDFTSLIETLLDFISKEQNLRMKDLLIDCLLNIKTIDGGKELSSSLIDAVVSSEFSEMTENTIHILAESSVIDEELHERIATLVASGIENGCIYYSLLLGFRIVNAFQNDEFTVFLWNSTLEFLQSNQANDQQTFVIVGNLEELIDIKYEFIDLVPLIEWLIAAIKEEAVDLTKSIVFCDLMTNSVATAIEMGTEIDTEGQVDIYMTCMNLSMKLYLYYCNDGTMNDVDLFEAICPIFSQNQEFISAIFSNIEEFSATKEGLTCFAISLTYFYKNIGEEISELFEAILEILCFLLNSSKPIMFETGAVSMHVLIETFPNMFTEEQISSIFSFLLKNLQNFFSNDSIELIEAILKNIEVSGEIISSLYEFIKEAHSANDFLSLTCLKHVLVHSPVFVNENFSDICQFLQEGYIASEEIYLVPQITDCIASVAVNAPPLFAENCGGMIEWITANILNDENEITVSSLKCISKFISSCSESVDPTQMIQNIAAILGNHEANSYLFALALSVFVYLANLYKDGNSEMIPLIIQSFEYIIENLDEDNCLLAARSLSNFAALSEQYKDIPEHVYSFAERFFEKDISSVIIAEVYSSFVQIVNNSSAEEAGKCITTFVSRFLENQLPGENGIENYDETLFSMVIYLIKASMEVFEEKSIDFYSNIIEKMHSFLSCEEIGKRNFAVQFFGELLYYPISAERGELPVLIIKEIIGNPQMITEAAIYAILQIFEGNSESVKEISEEVLAFLLQILTEELSPFNETIIATLATLIMKGTPATAELIKSIQDYGEVKFNDYEDYIFTDFLEWIQKS